MSSWSFSNFNKQLNQCCFQRPGVSINYSLRRNWPVWRCGEQQEPEAPHWYPPPPLATTVCSRCRCSDVCSILSRVGWIQHEWARVTGNGWEWAGVCGSWQWECRGRGRSGYGFMADAAVECDRRVGKAAGAPLCWRVWREPSSYSPVSKSSFFPVSSWGSWVLLPSGDLWPPGHLLFFLYVVVMLWLVTVIKVVALFVECLTLPAVWRSSYRGAKESLPKLCSEQQSLSLCS